MKTKDKFSLKDLFDSKVEAQKYNRRQVKAMKEGFYAGISLEYIKKYSSPRFDSKQLQQIYNGCWLTDAERNHFIKECYESGQMKEILKGYEHRLSKSQVDLFADANYSHYQMEQIRIGLECQHKHSELELYAKKTMKPMQMFIIRKSIDNGVSLPFLKLYATEEFNWLQMWQMYLAIKDGMSYQEVSEFLDAKCSWFRMYVCRVKYLHKFQMKDMVSLVGAIIND